MEKLPCNIGDEMWGIRNYKGMCQPKKGVVSEMFYTEDMELVIVLKHICRGVYGEKIFRSYEACLQALKRCY